MGLIELCEKYFQTSDIYEVFQISKHATDKEVKKAYYKLSLKLHPDRVEEREKLESTEKFKVLSGIHAILTDPDRRATYDLTKTVDDEDYEENFANMDWYSYWKTYFKSISDDDIKEFEKNYVGSEMEREDIKTAYLAGKGDMDHIWECVQFTRSDTEPRIREIINQMIKDGEVPSYDIFVNEPEKKRRKRYAMEKREAKEAEEIQKMKNREKYGENISLEAMIKQNQQNRAKQADSILDAIAEKYANKQRKQEKPNKRKAATKTEVAVTKKRRR